MIVRRYSQLAAYVLFVLVILFTVKLLHDRDVRERQQFSDNAAKVLRKAQIDDCKLVNRAIKTSERQHRLLGIPIDFGEALPNCREVSKPIPLLSGKE